MYAVQVEALSKVFYKANGKGFFGSLWGGRKQLMALDGVSFCVKPGEIFGIIGHNGSGKSTLIRILATLLYPTSGKAYIFDHDIIRHAAVVRRCINRVNVEASFFKVLSVWENILYSARLHGLGKHHVRRAIQPIMESLEFSEKELNTQVENLSRGMQQKVAIVRALLNTPRLLLLDEPTTGLDPVAKRSVQEAILRVREQHETTIILTSHDMAEMERLCERIMIINKGRIVQAGTVAELKQSLGSDTATLEDVFWYYTKEKWHKWEQ